jgi:hypothetical protein
MSGPPEFLESQPSSVVDLLNRLLDKGVVLDGELTISLADVELIYVGLKVLLVSASRLRAERADGASPPAPSDASGPAPETASPAAPMSAMSAAAPILESDVDFSPPTDGASAPTKAESAPAAPSVAAPALSPEVRIDPDRVEAGIIRLVLTVIEVLRRVMERQAVQRVEGGGLSEAQIERLGVGLMRLEEKMEELKREFDVTDEDLNLDLGPLGKLL